MNDPKDNPLIATLDRVPVQAIRIETSDYGTGPEVWVEVLIDSTWRKVFDGGRFRHPAETRTFYATDLIAAPVASHQGGIYLNRPIVTGGPEGDEVGGPLPESVINAVREGLVVPPALTTRPTERQAEEMIARVKPLAQIDDEIDRRRQAEHDADETIRKGVRTLTQGPKTDAEAKARDRRAETKTKGGRKK